MELHSYFAANHEEITDLIDGKDIIGSDSHITTSLLIGRPWIILSFINEGIWQENEAEEAAKYFKDSKKTQPFKPGDIKLRDLNGDYIIDDKDETYLGSQSPKWTGGFNNNFSYKDFDLNVYIIARWGRWLIMSWPVLMILREKVTSLLTWTIGRRRIRPMISATGSDQFL